MIIGHGVDVLEFSRLDRIFLNRFLVERFARRICSDVEYSVFIEKFCNTNQRSRSFLAKKFSIKESISKAIGCGIGKLLSFKDISIINSNLGKPEVEINKEIINAVNEVNNLTITQDELVFHLSISDDKSIVFTSAILYVA